MTGASILSAAGRQKLGTDLEEKLARCCRDQVKQIALAMHRYAKTHDGHFPDRPSQLKPYVGGSGPHLFICPASDTRLTPGKDGWAAIDRKTSYVLVPDKTQQNPGEIVLYEKGHNHGRMRVVLYGDGHQQSVVDAHPRLTALEAGN